MSFDISTLSTDDLIMELGERFDVLAIAGYRRVTGSTVVTRYEFKGDPFALDGLLREARRRSRVAKEESEESSDDRYMS